MAIKKCNKCSMPFTSKNGETMCVLCAAVAMMNDEKGA
jgi:uncharacterized Zn finger protein (UPF0148 family)